MKLNKKSLTQKCSDLISMVAQDKEIDVLDLQYIDFKSALKDQVSKEFIKQVCSHISSLGGFAKFKKYLWNGNISNIQVEKQKLSNLAYLNQNNIYNKTYNIIFEEFLTEKLSSIFSKINKKPGKNYVPSKNVDKNDKRVISLVLSDLHLGANLSEDEVKNKFTYTEEARRLASIIVRTCDFKRDYRDNTELVVLLLGDLIKGLIHGNKSGKKLAEQVADAIWLLWQCFVVLATNFKKITIYGVSGNHDRNPLIDSDRSVDNKWDSFATHIYSALKVALMNYKNITFVIPKTPFIEYSPFPNNRVFATHGDNVLDASYPSSVIDIKKIESQILRINGGEMSQNKQPYKLFILAHAHTGCLIHLPSAELLINGCLTPSDQYAVSKGYTYCKCGQYLFESTKDYLVGDSRFYSVNETIDKDESLDKIIVPFSGSF